MEHIWTMLMQKILQNHLLCAFVANLKIGAICALYPESFCDKNLAIRKVFAFCDSADALVPPVPPVNSYYQISFLTDFLIFVQIGGGEYFCETVLWPSNCPIRYCNTFFFGGTFILDEIDRGRDRRRIGRIRFPSLSHLILSFLIFVSLWRTIFSWQQLILPWAGASSRLLVWDWCPWAWCYWY